MITATQFLKLKSPNKHTRREVLCDTVFMLRGRLMVYFLLLPDGCSLDPDFDPEQEISGWKQWTQGAGFDEICGLKRTGKRWIPAISTPDSSYGPEGQGFESLRACQKIRRNFMFLRIFVLLGAF